MFLHLFFSYIAIPNTLGFFLHSNTCSPEGSDRGVKAGMEGWEGMRELTILHMQMPHHRDPKLYGLERCPNHQEDAENPLEKNLGVS